MQGKIRTVIFDIDNTLYDFAAANRKGLDAVAGYMEREFSWEKERFEECHTKVQYEIYDRLHYNGSCRDRLLRYLEMLERAGLPLQPHALRMYHTYWDTLIGSISPFEGAAETMDALKKRGIRIGVMTDMTAYMQMRKLDKLGLLQYVDFVVTSEEAGEEKPSEAIFRLGLEKSLCRADECLMVGDHPEKDYGGALKAGMKALLFSAGAENLPGDGDRISALKQVLAHV